MEENLVTSVAAFFNLQVTDNADGQAVLAARINELISTDFQKLISILYRMDINEKKLKKLLHDNPEKNAGMLIADLMIQRQLEKIKSRRESRKDDAVIPDDEKW